MLKYQHVHPTHPTLAYCQCNFFFFLTGIDRTTSGPTVASSHGCDIVFCQASMEVVRDMLQIAEQV